ncbi:MAG: DUF190 domain-containing protein [Terriglobales bacterium]
MLATGTAQRVTIFVGEGHRRHGRSVYMAVFDFLYYHRVAGATVTRGIAGFGADHHLHSADILAASENLPIKIEFIESEDRLQELLPKIRDIIGDGVIAVQPIQVYFAGGASAPASKAAPVPLPHAGLEGRGKLMRIYVRERDRWHGRPLHEAIVESLRAHDLAGVTVYQGIAGYGAGARHPKGGAASGGPPMMLSVVDTEERIRAYLPLLDDMLTGGLVVLSDVEVIKYSYAGNPPEHQP